MSRLPHYAMERGVVVGKSREIKLGDLPPLSGRSEMEEDGNRSLAKLERRDIAQVLAAESGNISSAPKVLRINRTTRCHKIEKYGLLS